MSAGVAQGRLVVFALGGHSLLSVLPPKKLREPPSALRGAFCHEVTRIDSQCCTLRSPAQKRLGLTQNGKLCFISRQKDSLCFRVAQKDPKLFIVHQKEPDSVRARKSFVCQQNCKCLARTSVTSTLRHFGNALNAFGLFARVNRLPLDNVTAMPMLTRWGISNIDSPCGSPTSTWLT